MLFSIARNKLFVGFMVFLLTLAILFNFGVKPIVEAKAFALAFGLTASVGALVASMLVASGISFPDATSLDSAIVKVWNGAGKLVRDGLSAAVAAAGLPDTGAVIKEQGVNVSWTLLGAFAEVAKKVFPPTATSIPSGAIDININTPPPSGTVIAPFEAGNTLNFTYAGEPFKFSLGVPYVSAGVINISKGSVVFDYTLSGKGKVVNSYDFVISDPALAYSVLFSLVYAPIAGKIDTTPQYQIVGTGSYTVANSSKVHNIKYSYPLSGDCPADLLKHSRPEYYSFTGISAGADVINPSIDYAPDRSICVDGLLTKAIDDVIAANPDKVGTDVLVKPNVGDLVDTKAKDVLIDKTLTDAMDKILEKLGELTDEGEIAIPKLGELSLPETIITVFPFCIPFDIGKGIKLLQAEPVTPRFEIPFVIPNLISEKVVIDFAPYDKIAQICRWLEIFAFTIWLAFATRKVIKW